MAMDVIGSIVIQDDPRIAIDGQIGPLHGSFVKLVKSMQSRRRLVG